MFDGTLLLGATDVRSVITVRDAVEVARNVYTAHGTGHVVMPPKLTLDLGESGGWPHLKGASNAMPAYVAPYDAAGIKWASGYRDNRSRGLPRVTALIVLNDPCTGLPVCVMDGTLITDLRTGASAAVFIEALATPGWSGVGLLGAGAQGRAVARALGCIWDGPRPLEVRCYDRVAEASVALSNMEDLGKPGRLGRMLDVRAVGSIDEALDGADVVVTATSADKPLVEPRHVRPGATIVTIGSFPELDPAIVLHADKIVVDNWEQNTHRGELAPLIQRGLVTRERLHAEIGEILARRRPGRETSDEVIVCSPIGIGSLDVALAKLAFDRARDRGLGTRFDFVPLSAG